MDKNRATADQEKIDEAVANRDIIDRLKASTDEAKSQADQELRRSLELRSSFYEKLAALDAGTIAIAVSVGIALLAKFEPHSSLLHANFGWLVVIGFFLWLSLICALGHNAIFIKIARLEAEKAREWSKWVSLVNASTMSTVAGTKEISEAVDKVIKDTFHNRIQEGAMNQHRTEQSVLILRVLGAGAVLFFLIAYTLIFVCIVRLWWIAR